MNELEQWALARAQQLADQCGVDLQADRLELVVHHSYNLPKRQQNRNYEFFLFKHPGESATHVVVENYDDEVSVSIMAPRHFDQFVKGDSRGRGFL